MSSTLFLAFSICCFFHVEITSGNIALNKPTEQSSTIPTGDSWRAVDSNRNPSLAQGGSCAQTKANEPGNAWWYVDLLRDYPIKEVEIVARGDGQGYRFSDWDLIIAKTEPPRGFSPLAGGQICDSQSGTTRDGQVFTIHCNETIGRYIGIQMRKPGTVLELCEVEVDVRQQATNIAQGKRTLQFDTSSRGNSSRAVDGNRNMFYHSGSCTHTSAKRGGGNNWWAVDLGEEVAVTRVVLYNRADCCGNRLANFDIVLTNKEPTPGKKFEFGLDEVCAHKSGSVRQGATAIFACSNITGQYVAVVQPRSHPLTLCEVEVFDHVIPAAGNNLALKKPTSQFDDLHGIGPSSNAVDGNRGQIYHTHGCTHTTSSSSDTTNNNWWSVDLERNTAVTSVVLYNRGDCCGTRLADFDIVVTDTAPVRGARLTYTSSQVCFHKFGAVGQGDVVTFSCFKEGRYVAVVRSRREPLTLCEVEVYGVPSVSVPKSTSKTWNYLPTALPIRGVTVPPTMAPKMRQFLNAEHRLMVELFKNYDKGVRPVGNISDKVLVNLGMAAVSIVEVHEQEETITMNSWMRYTWHDIRLTWNPADYDGVTVLRVRWDKVWRPDITLYNSFVPQSNAPSNDDTMVIFYSDGTVLFIPHVHLKAMCQLDLTAFPMDTQTCHFKFGSWAFDGFMLDLGFYEGREEIDLSDYVADGEWTVIDASGRRNEKYYPCCVEPYPDITYNITFKRRGNLMVFCGPAILLCFMIPLVFLVPHGTGDKTALGFCLLLCLLLMIVSLEGVFPASYLPMLVYYYVFSFILVGISLFITTLVNNIFIGCTMAPPNVIFQACRGIGKLMCVTTASAKTDTFALMDSEGNTTGSPSNVRGQWIYIATVCDRIMFVVFFIIVTILTATMITKA